METSDLNLDEKDFSEKKYVTAVVLSGVFGVVGIHHFYVERWAMGAIDLGLFIITLYFYFTGNILLAGLFFLGDSVHTVVVTYLLLVGQYKDGHGKIIKYPGQKG